MSGVIIAESIIALAAIKTIMQLGCWGEKVVEINIDDENPKVFPGFFWNKATWEPNDCYLTVYTRSWKPIRFERTNQYSALFGGMTPSQKQEFHHIPE